MVSVLFVCLGNICRSPLAEAIFNHQVKQKKLHEHFQSASAGTADYHIGDPPDSRTIRNALKNGVTIDHLGQQFTAEHLETYDLIVPMDRSNLANLLQIPGAEKFRDKIRLMRCYDSVDCDSDVPDPYYGSEKNFQDVFEILDRSMKNFIEHLETGLKTNAPVTHKK
jgi:protein-tyrosine phosphatase